MCLGQKFVLEHTNTTVSGQTSTFYTWVSGNNYPQQQVAVVCILQSKRTKQPLLTILNMIDADY